MVLLVPEGVISRLFTAAPTHSTSDSIIHLFLALRLMRHTEGSKKTEEDHLPITPESPRLSAKVSGASPEDKYGNSHKGVSRQDPG